MSNTTQPCTSEDIKLYDILIEFWLLILFQFGVFESVQSSPFSVVKCNKKG